MRTSSSSGGRESTLRTARSISSAGRGGLFQAADQPVGAVGQEVAGDPLAVAEEQRLGHADLGVAARGREGRGERASARPPGPRSASRIGSDWKSAGRLAGSAVASRSEVASCIGVRGRTRATAKSDGRGDSLALPAAAAGIGLAQDQAPDQPAQVVAVRRPCRGPARRAARDGWAGSPSASGRAA